MTPGPSTRVARCPWAGPDPGSIAYHDEEWGVPTHADIRLFEMLVLEGAQAGLSWNTILKKRDNYRRAFSQFDPRRVARYDGRRVARLLSDAGLVRHRLKIESAVANARAWLRVEREFDTFARYVWRFVDGAPVQNRWRRMSDVPTRTPASEALSADLKQRGFRFVGPTICYSFMQATGMVNDHLLSCFRYGPLSQR